MDVFIARQPIFDRNDKLVAYELLFRSSLKNSYDNQDGNKATIDVISNIATIGINNVLSGKKAFINFTGQLLQAGIPVMLEPSILTVEILESVEPSPDIIEECKKLKSLGYKIALDDFVFSPKYKELLNFVDIIKVDFRQTLGLERKYIIDRIKPKEIKFLAEKVETVEEFNQARAYGYTYFQGYYFSKPIILKGKGIPPNKKVGLRLLCELSKEEIDNKTITGLIAEDISITFQLLKYINSSVYGFRDKISSINHAIALLGQKELVKWLYTVVIKDMGKDENSELVTNSLIRAKFCEMLCMKCGDTENSVNAYIMGMLSLIDVILHRPLEEIIKELYVPSTVKDALLGTNNSFHPIFNLAISYEKANWCEVMNACKKLSISEKDISNIYIETLKWLKSII